MWGGEERQKDVGKEGGPQKPPHSALPAPQCLSLPNTIGFCLSIVMVGRRVHQKVLKVKRNESLTTETLNITCQVIDYFTF
jgi:hypothetical protein